LPTIFLLDAFGFQEEAIEISTHIAAFFSGMLVWELVL